jgi:peptide/nickel transport system permease protein
VTSYVVRRLLLMIPTLFGVTLVSFAIMQLAPGDPLLSGGDDQGGAREASRDSYLVQKRSLGLDKPAMVNLNGFYDYGPAVRAAAYILGRSTNEIAAELPALNEAGDDSDVGRRRRFLAALKIPDFQTRLAEASRHATLARTIVDFVTVWCEDAGAAALPATMQLVGDGRLDVPTRRGAIHVLNHLVRDPFVYTYRREPSDAETPAVVATWRLWWERRPKQDSNLSARRRRELSELFAGLLAASSRSALMEGLETLTKTDAPFFVERLLDESSPLAEKNIASLALRLTIGKPLKPDVSPRAEQAEIDAVALNWAAYYDVAKTNFETALGKKIWNVVGDTQYARLVGRLATFDFGTSAIGTHEPVGRRIWDAFKVSAPLMLASEVLIYLTAVPLGIICAVYRGRFWDRLISCLLFALYSVPTFIAAMFFLLVFCYGTHLRWFPMSGLHSDLAGEMSWGMWLWDYARHAFLPVVCLSLFSLAGLAMYARSSMLEVISADYIRTARAKGEPERRVIWRDALRNALLPVITLSADFLPAMLGGSVLVEVLFSIPGMGRLSWASIEQKDYPTLMALVYVNAIVVLIGILLADLLYYLVDPRISLHSADEAA